MLFEIKFGIGVGIEKYATSLQFELEEAVAESEASHKTIENFESKLCILSDNLGDAARDIDWKNEVLFSLVQVQVQAQAQVLTKLSSEHPRRLKFDM